MTSTAVRPPVQPLYRPQALDHKTSAEETIRDGAFVEPARSDSWSSAPREDATHRKLKSRHIQLIGIGGTIGTVLFVRTSLERQVFLSFRSFINLHLFFFQKFASSMLIRVLHCSSGPNWQRPTQWWTWQPLHCLCLLVHLCPRRDGLHGRDGDLPPNLVTLYPLRRPLCR